jgi:hypothetical protein
MEELVEAVLAGVAEAKTKGLSRYEFFFARNCCECNIELEALVREQLPNHGVNYLTTTHPIRGVEKRLIITW